MLVCRSFTFTDVSHHHVSGVPHTDVECNDTIILGFMMAQFIADFRYQVSYLTMSITFSH